MKQLVFAAVLLVSACAAQAPAPAPQKTEPRRYLSAEQDQQLKERCSPYEAIGGCAVIPVPLFRKLIQALKACHQEHSL